MTDTSNILLTLLAAYNADMKDLMTDEVQINGNALSTADTALMNAQVTILSELIRRNHQVVAVLVRKMEDGSYIVLNGLPTYLAMKHLGYTRFTATVIKCADESLPDIEKMCKLDAVSYPPEIVLGMFQELKAQVSSDLRGMKKRGEITSMHTDQTLADLLDTNTGYIKAMDQITKAPDFQQAIDDLKDGKSLSTIVKPGKTPNEKVPTAITLHNCSEYHDKLDGMCENCPGRELLKQLLEERQKHTK